MAKCLFTCAINRKFERRSKTRQKPVLIEALVGLSFAGRQLGNIFLLQVLQLGMFSRMPRV